MLNLPWKKTAAADNSIRFEGKSRADAKRKALNYWYINQEKLKLDIHEFSSKCRLLEDDKTIVFYRER